MAVNITDILARLRVKAATAGIDLSQPFFFPPDHPRYFQIIAEFEVEREERIARLRRSKSKWRRHLALTGAHNIKVAPERDAQLAASMHE
jgi:hypothetical protein